MLACEAKSWFPPDSDAYIRGRKTAVLAETVYTHWLRAVGKKDSEKGIESKNIKTNAIAAHKRTFYLKTLENCAHNTNHCLQEEGVFPSPATQPERCTEN